MCRLGASLGCSHHEIVEFVILSGGSRPIIRVTTLDFRRANFGLFTDLLRGILWVRALKGRRVQKSWLLFAHHFLHAQDWCIPMSKKSSKGGRRPAWMNKKLLAKLKLKKKEGHLEGIQEHWQSIQGCEKEMLRSTQN